MPTRFRRQAPGRLDEGLDLALIIASLAVLGFALRYQYLCWTYPYTLIYNEVSTLLHARLELQGIDPWSADLHPLAVQIYGLVWPKAAAAICGLGLPCGLGTLRFLSSLCLALSDALTYAACRKSGAGKAQALAWTALFHLGQLHFNGATARADNAAVLLNMAGWLLPWILGYRPWSLGLGLLASVTAALCKPYAGLAGPLLVLGYWQQAGPKRALGLGALWAAALALATVLVWRSHETYAYSTVLWSIQATTRVPEWMLTQLQWWAQWFVGPAILALALGATAPLAWGTRHLPLAVAALAGLGAFVGGMGWHIRTTLTYLHHLVSPALIPLAAAAAGQPPWRRRALSLALLIGLPLAAYAGVDRDFLRNRRGYLGFWKHQEKLLEGKTRVLVPAEWAPLLWARGLALPDAGDTECGDLGPPPPALARLFPRWAELKQRHHAFLARRYDEVARGLPDLVIWNDTDPELTRALKKRYVLKERLPTPWYFRAWPPEPSLWVRR